MSVLKKSNFDFIKKIFIHSGCSIINLIREKNIIPDPSIGSIKPPSAAYNLVRFIGSHAHLAKHRILWFRCTFASDEKKSGESEYQICFHTLYKTFIFYLIISFLTSYEFRQIPHSTLR